MGKQESEGISQQEPTKGTDPGDLYTSYAPFMDSLTGTDSVEGFENIGYLTGGFQTF
jgi:hypothetical protein